MKGNMMFFAQLCLLLCWMLPVDSMTEFNVAVRTERSKYNSSSFQFHFCSKHYLLAGILPLVTSNETCFKIKTCSGAFLKNYSYYDQEKEVLIPPYEMFMMR
ncbi:T-cell ecto-ADP-ribosyltransferase 1-like [Micropterus salmoides]|uniref:T-cell ecto-ADP-ribosyltransferase 1-like n=1 Tax=Micropterus salmoides TaxID=27706 RepID=UPI0018EA42A1|nr:T-cell ecto-ADP-ribosyltransferase 1-like [Micropterus salmoides]